MRTDRIPRSRHFEPVRVLLQGGQKSLEPAVAVTVLVRLWPNAKFFEVVTHGCKPARVLLRSPAQKLNGLRDVSERNQVAQYFQSGKDSHTVAEVFGEIVAIELSQFEPGAKEMVIVDERVFDACGRKRRGHLRLPDALGQPCAARPRLKVLLDVIRGPGDLLVAILRRNYDKDRFLEAATHHFHLSALDQRPKPLEILRVCPLNPFE